MPLRRRTVLINGGLVVVLAGVAVVGWTTLASGSSTSTGRTATVHKGTFLATVAATGTVISPGDVGVSFSSTGTVTKIDRIIGTLTVQQTQSGTVGAGNGATAEEFKVQDGAMLNDVHAGDRVSFSVTGTGDTKTITKLDKP